MLKFLQPAAHIERLPKEQIDPTYRRLRWQIFFGIFFGYAAYYLVRKNFALAIPYLQEEGFSKADLGFALSAFHSLWFLKIYFRLLLRSCQSALFLTFRLDTGSLHHAHHGCLPMGHLLYRRDVRLALHLRLVSGNGLASLRSYHGALVVTERTRQYRFCMELRP